VPRPVFHPHPSPPSRHDLPQPWHQNRHPFAPHGLPTYPGPIHSSLSSVLLPVREPLLSVYRPGGGRREVATSILARGERPQLGCQVLDHISPCPKLQDRGARVAANEPRTTLSITALPASCFRLESLPEPPARPSVSPFLSLYI
jgi:hypothetical protein